MAYVSTYICIHTHVHVYACAKITFHTHIVQNTLSGNSATHDGHIFGKKYISDRMVSLFQVVK